MNKLLISAASAAIVLTPSTALAQALPAAVVAIVDIDKINSQCNACVNAVAALRTQASAEETREKALAAPLDAEHKSIQAAIDALKDKQPDAALQARIQAFQGKQEQFQQAAMQGRQQIQRNQAFINQQIQAKLGPIYTQVMTRHGANVMLEQGATLAAASSLDVTADVLAALNAALPTVVTIAPAQAQQQPQGR